MIIPLYNQFGIPNFLGFQDTWYQSHGIKLTEVPRNFS